MPNNLLDSVLRSLTVDLLHLYQEYFILYRSVPDNLYFEIKEVFPALTVGEQMTGGLTHVKL
jgi:hypothetical protein